MPSGALMTSALGTFNTMAAVWKDIKASASTHFTCFTSTTSGFTSSLLGAAVWKDIKASASTHFTCFTSTTSGFTSSLLVAAVWKDIRASVYSIYLLY